MTTLIRCSSIGKIMTSAQSMPDDAPVNILEIKRKTKRTDEEKATFEAFKESILSETAKTYLTGLAKEQVYSYRGELNTKIFEKGKRCEQEAIDLINSVYFMDLEKNIERRNNGIITGEPDLIIEDTIWDVKNAWSIETFPSLPEDAHNSDYEWQIRGYLCLFDKQFGGIRYCFVDTPEELCRYEPQQLHQARHIPTPMRVTPVDYVRDMVLEAKMLAKCKLAQQYIESQIERIKAAHIF